MGEKLASRFSATDLDFNSFGMSLTALLAFCIVTGYSGYLGGRQAVLEPSSSQR